MFVTLHRSGQNALFVRAGTPLTEIPLHVIQWLGVVETSEDAELEDDTPMLALSPMEIMRHIEADGYCALGALSRRQLFQQMFLG